MTLRSEVPTGADYVSKIIPQHRGKPRFAGTVASVVGPVADLSAFLASIPVAFDLDQAIGVQLDVIGEWVGVSRDIQVPLVSVWFSFGLERLGFGQGLWKGPYDPTTGIAKLDDDTYRALIRLKIAANGWDGSTESAQSALSLFYEDIGVIDRADMSFDVVLAGDASMIRLAIFAGRYVEFKPAGVRVRNLVPSVPATPAFGFGVSNSVIGGFGEGSWVISAEDALSA